MKLHHKIKHLVHHQHGKKHPHPHHIIHVNLHGGKHGESPEMILAHSFQEHERKQKIRMGEMYQVVVKGLGTFSVMFTETMVKMLNALGNWHVSGGSGGSHPSSSSYSQSWLMRKYQEYCDETFREAYKEHHQH